MNVNRGFFYEDVAVLLCNPNTKDKPVLAGLEWAEVSSACTIVCVSVQLTHSCTLGTIAVVAEISF